MKKIIILLNLLTIVLFASDSKINDSKTIINWMENSEIAYELKGIKEKDFVDKKSYPLITDIFYKSIEKNKSVTFKKYTVDKKYDADFKKAEEYFLKGDYKNAREYYKNVLKGNDKISTILTYVGQTYFMEKDYDNSLIWLEKAVKANNIDYLAHWILASTYVKKQNCEKAKDEMIYAHLFNRNNTRLLKEMNDILKLNKLKPNNWKFDLNYNIIINDKSKTTIEMQENHVDCMIYFVTIALWMTDSDYVKSKQIKNDIPEVLAETEAVINLYAAAISSKKDYSQFEFYKYLKKSAESKDIHSFIIYETLLPKYPHIIFNMDQKGIDKLKDYFIKYHTEKL